MHKPGDGLHRATPIPSLEPMGSRRASGTLSVSSIVEEDETEDHDSATSLVERPADKAARKHAAKLGKLSPIPSGKAFVKRNSSGHGSPDEGGPARILASLRSLHRKSNNSGPPSPTVSEDSEGSGATFRSAESLHRPTPIPQDASSSYALPGSFSRRSSGRAQPTTPTINEFETSEDIDEEPAAAPPHLTLKEQGKSSSLHRPTPIPSDLLSSGSSLGRSRGDKPAAPMIREDDGQNEGESDLDSNEHYYGAQQLPEDGGSVYTTPRENHTEQSSSLEQPPHTVRHAFKPPEEQAGQNGTKDFHEGRTQAEMAHSSGRLTTGIPSPSAVATSAPASPGFSPFVESRDWERDILGVARFLRMCPGLSRQIIGDLLGENNERCLRVLECFTASFDFRGLSFEAALREYIEAFRMPGEAQKIYRILDTWSHQFYKQCPGIFRSADAVLVLAYSLILLNTDLHNQQSKKKMTCEQFIGNNKGMNANNDFPRDFLEELFKNIERRGIRFPAAHPPEGLSSRVSLPQPVRVAQERYSSPEKARKRGFLCF